MTPLMTLKRDFIVEASVLRSTREEPGLFPTPEDEVTLLGKEDEQSEVLGPTPRHFKVLRFVEPAEQTTAPVTSAAPCLVSEPHSFPSQKGKLWVGIDMNPNNPSQ